MVRSIKTVTTTMVTAMEACCAWDLHVWLYSDPSIPTWYEPVHIPAFYVTMEEGSQLLATMAESDNAGGAVAVGVTMYARWAPTYNPSAALIWALGVLVCFVASYLSASEYRGLRFEAKRRLFEMTIGSSSAESPPRSSPTTFRKKHGAPRPELPRARRPKHTRSKR